MGEAPFITVGENIHCTRIYKVGGSHVRELDRGSHAVVYQESGHERLLPIPASYLESDDWERSRVRHVAVAIWQGMYGDHGAGDEARGYIHCLARRQQEAGASYLDLNVDQFSHDIQERVRAMRWIVEVVRTASELPLSIDSSSMEILREGLEAAGAGNSRSMVNSVSLERLQAIELAADAGAAVIAGATGERGMPSGKEERISNLHDLVDRLLAAGFREPDIHLDPLVLPASVDSNNGPIVLNSIRELRDTYGLQVHFAPGLSNISYGMPNRKLINQVFTHLCILEGLDGGIVDPLQINARVLAELDTSTEAYALARAFLLGEDEFGMNYITAAREGRI